MASQTDKSVQDIQIVVDEMQKASGNIVEALNGIKESVSIISKAASNVALAVETQSTTTSDIAINMQSAAHETQVIAKGLQDVSASSLEASSASGQMVSDTQDLSQQAQKLNNQVDNFLLHIRTS